MSLHVCRHSDVERIYGDESFRVMEMYGFSPTSVHCDCYSSTHHTGNSTHNTHHNTTQSQSAPSLPTWLVQKLRGEFEQNEAASMHNPNAFASPSNPSASATPSMPAEPSQQPHALSDNIAAVSIQPVPPVIQQPVIQHSDDSDEIPAEVIEASRRSVIEDELGRAKRDSEMQQKYIHDVEIALQESVQSIVNTVSKIANTVVDGVVGLVNAQSENLPKHVDNNVDTHNDNNADNIQNVQPAEVAPNTHNAHITHNPEVPIAHDLAVLTPVTTVPTVQPTTPQNNPECMICFDDECGAVNTVFIPCGHTCCEKCASAVEICPKCKAPITSRNRFFL